MAERQRPTDIVDEAFGVMREKPVPQGPSPQAALRVARAVELAQAAAPKLGLLERIRNMNRLVKYPLAACIALALLASAAFVFWQDTPMAFADVRQQVEKAQTMSLRAVADMKVGDQKIKTSMVMYFKTPRKWSSKPTCPR